MDKWIYKIDYYGTLYTYYWNRELLEFITFQSKNGNFNTSHAQKKGNELPTLNKSYWEFINEGCLFSLALGSYIHVSYSWRNDWTKLPDFLGNPRVPWE